MLHLTRSRLNCHFTHNIAVLGTYLCSTIADNSLAANGFLFTNFTTGTIMLPKVAT
jgi:hypothetical protein